MKRQTILLIIAVLGIMPCGAKRKATKDIEVSVAQYRYDCECAVSLTFDDGIQEDYTLIAPHLDRCGLKGTFCINGAFIGDSDDRFAPRMTWDQCRELDTRGHEIASHSWSHLNEYEISIEETRREIARNDSAIQRELGKRPLTYFFPFNAYTPEALEAAMEHRVACRLYQFGLGQLNLEANKTSMTAWLKEQIEGRKWGITMTHGIYTAWDQWEEPWVLWDFFRLLSEKKDSVWTATFANVAMYMTERDSVRLAVKHERNIVRVTPSLSLDQRIYTMPLTLNLRSTKPIFATQDGKSLPILRNGGKTFLEFNPFGGEIIITQLEDCKRISVLGDSYSTIYGWITPGNEPFYPHGDVVDAGQTWWQQVVSSGRYVLECNNSYSGSTMTNNTLPNWRDRSHKMEVSTSFISRCTNLGNPDIILICGGTNDEWNNDKSMGEFKYGNWKENDLKLFRPGTAYLLSLVKTTYPKAEVYFVLNDILERVGESIKTICDHYDIPVIAPQGIEKDESGHPTQAGMTTIADAVKLELQIKK